MANKTKNRLRERYSQVSNKIANNYNLSFSAIGLYTFINSKPDGWEFSYRGIMAQRRNPNDADSKPKEGENALKALIRELTLEGALVRVKASFYNENVGGYGGYDWIINPDKEDIELARHEDPVLIRLIEEVEICGVKVGGNIKLIQETKRTKQSQAPKQETKKPKQNNFNNFVDQLEKAFTDKKILSLKDKINRTNDAKKAFKLINDEDIKKVVTGFTSYVAENKKLASRLNLYLYAFAEGALENLNYDKNIINNSTTNQKQEGYFEKKERELREEAERITRKQNSVIDTEILIKGRSA